jgi:glycosyltransferase involved in cell wall biosynthesis
MRLPCVLEAQILRAMPIAHARRIAQQSLPTSSTVTTGHRPSLFVDVSVFSTHDAGTGIQRVVREVMAQLFENSTYAFKVVPVAATKHNGYRTASIALNGIVKAEVTAGQPVSASGGDIFLGLDFAAHLLSRHYHQLLGWKRAGVSIQIVVYDLLPILRPEWFKPRAVKNFKKWLSTLAVFADRFHCISHTVRIELINWIHSNYSVALKEESVYVFPLGSNLEAVRSTDNSTDLHSQYYKNALVFAQKQTSILMVGTVEPRKGHAEVLAAFVDLWRQGSVVQLIVVGTPGWKTEAVQQIMLTKSSAENDKLLWLQNADDVLLMQLYSLCKGVIVASKGEGFGLPLIEAAQYGKHILARDIPVFREVQRGNVTFFPESSDTGLTSTILKNWMLSWNNTNHIKPALDMPNWLTSAEVLISNTGLTKATTC